MKAKKKYHANIFTDSNVVCYVIDLNIQLQNYTVDESDSFLDVLITLDASIERDVELDFVTVDGRATAGTYTFVFISKCPFQFLKYCNLELVYLKFLTCSCS